MSDTEQCINGNAKRKKTVSFLITDVETKPVLLPVHMENSILDTKSSRVLNFPLTVNQQLWTMFLLPSIVQSTFYILDLATDLAISIELLYEQYIWTGLVTLIITYSAPLVSYVTHLSNPPSENEFKVLFIWFLTETAAFILFPLRPIKCFGERLFWSIEALRTQDPLREDALINFESTKYFAIENYLFLQGILHAAPQAIFQTLLLLLETSSNPNTKKVQALGICTSLLSFALITTNYQRYETQVKGDRRKVWERMESLALDSAEPQVLITGTSNILPKHRPWVKVMDEDNPLGSVVAFIFWFLFIFGRILCLTVAATFFPWAVLGVCAVHYIFTFLYILPSPDCKSSIMNKILLSIVFILCLIEVGVQFRKSSLFFSLFVIFSVAENFCLTLLWFLWAHWSGFWYYYSIYLMCITHALAILFLILYIKLFKPKMKRIQPTN